jgi:hypothetical protein
VYKTTNNDSENEHEGVSATKTARTRALDASRSDGWMDAPTALTRSTFYLLYDDDVTNDSDSGEGDFCASGDATKRTRVCVEAIDDDAQQVREMRRG